MTPHEKLVEALERTTTYLQRLQEKYQGKQGVPDTALLHILVANEQALAAFHAQPVEPDPAPMSDEALVEHADHIESLLNDYPDDGVEPEEGEK